MSRRTRRLRERAPALLLCGLLALPVAASRAEEATEPPLPEPTPLTIGPNLVERTGPWLPPPYTPEKKDWLRLNSGEWVRGTIEGIKDDTVYFDSDELDDLKIDWEDVASLRSPRRNTYRFRQRTIVTGTAGMQDGVIRVDTGEEVVEFGQYELVGMIEGDLREINYWSLDAGLGLTQRSGNSDQTDASVRVEVKRETPLTRALVGYQSAYSVVDNQEVTNNQRLSGQFNFYVSKRLFIVLPTLEGFRDRFQNIDLRATAGAGVGYDLVDRPRVDWRAVVGAAYQRTEFDEAPPGEERGSNDAAATFSTTLELDPTGDIEWDSDYNISLVVTDLGKTNHHLQSVLSIDLLGPLDLDITFIWDRIERPKRNESGELPKHNDFRTTVGVAVDL